MSAWYKDHLINVTNGSATVTGVGTLWQSAGLTAGDIFLTDANGPLYEIESIDGEDSLTLTTAYAGTTETNFADYAIIRIQTGTTLAEIVQRITDVTLTWSTRETELATWQAGVAGGGPNSDGTYPFTQVGGSTIFVKSPAQQAQDVQDVIDDLFSLKRLAYEDERFTATGGQTEYTLSVVEASEAGEFFVFKNGAILQTSSYSFDEPTQKITFSPALELDDIIDVRVAYSRFEEQLGEIATELEGQADAAIDAAAAAAISEANAAASEAAAATSESNAADSETNAATSAADSAGSAANAADSETNAAASEAAAATSETNAAASEAAAATSETNAAASEAAAATSETNAAASASAAATSETNAAASASAAETAETNAETAETNAAASAAAAATSETNAAASEAGVAADAAAATTAAANAATSETNAATSEANAATSETNAAASATAAETAETNAETAETNAAASAASIGAAEANCAASAADAATSEALAEQWANEAENVEVEPGLYSAYHWSQKAQASATGSLIYQGPWDASGGTYPSSPTLGDFYKISVAGTISSIDYAVGDHLIYNGSAWDKLDNTEAVTSVNGQLGAVVIPSATQTTEGLVERATDGEASARTDTTRFVTPKHLGDLKTELDADYEPIGEAASAVSTHEGLANPHPQYLTETEGDGLYAALGHDHDADYEPIGEAASAVSTHEGLANPHPQYLTETEGDGLYAALGHDHDADYEPIGTATTEVAAHEADPDPHPQYKNLSYSRITTNTTAVAGEGYAPGDDDLELTLPASPSAGDRVAFSNPDNHTGTTILRNGEPIMSLAEDLDVDTDFVEFNLVYLDGTRGWIFA